MLIRVRDTVNDSLSSKSLLERKEWRGSKVASLASVNLTCRVLFLHIPLVALRIGLVSILSNLV